MHPHNTQYTQQEKKSKRWKKSRPINILKYSLSNHKFYIESTNEVEHGPPPRWCLEIDKGNNSVMWLRQSMQPRAQFPDLMSGALAYFSITQGNRKIASTKYVEQSETAQAIDPRELKTKTPCNKTDWQHGCKGFVLYQGVDFYIIVIMMKPLFKSKLAMSCPLLVKRSKPFVLFSFFLSR